MSRPLKLKVQEPRGLTVFQLPDHGFKGCLRGRTADVLSLKPVEETDSMCPALSPAPLCLPRFGFVTMSDAGSRHLALPFLVLRTDFPWAIPALRPALMAGRMHPADQTMRYLPHP